MNTHLAQVVVKELQVMGHEVQLFGALVTEPAPWSGVAIEVAQEVASGKFA